jgi:hypothetical protein
VTAPDGDPGTEVLEQSRPPISRRNAVRLGALVAVALAAAAAVKFAHSDAPRAPVAPPTTSTGPAPIALPGADALIPAGSSRAGAVPGLGIYETDLVNATGGILTLSGPVMLRGPDGTAVPLAQVLITNEPSAGQYVGVEEAPAPLQHISAGQKVVLTFSVRLDCGRDAAEAGWPATFPTIAIPLAGYARPATYAFSDLFSGVNGFLRGACG